MDGITLREVIDRGAIPPDIAIFIIEQMLLGLNAAHKQGVLHRDLKPENVLISLDGFVKLCDFGFSSQVNSTNRRGEIRGTIGYMAPEVVFDGVSDEQSDLFSVGTILYEMLLGSPAYFAEHIGDYLDVLQRKDANLQLESCSFIAQDVRYVCSQLLHKKPSGRVESVVQAIELVRGLDIQGSRQAHAELLSQWWSDPNSYEFPVSQGVPEGDREPVKAAEAEKKKHTRDGFGVLV